MRVVAGIAKGRSLVAPKGMATRPTTDKVKEAIFSMLSAEGFRRAEADEDTDFPWSRVLDLYAGSGALGIEALSRGSEHVDFVDSNARARAAIQENLRRTGLTQQASIHGLRAESAVSTFKGAYDLILLDPPYEDASVPGLLDTIGQAAILGPEGIVVFEHAKTRESAARAGRLQLIRTRHYGTTAVSLYRHEDNA